MCLFLLALQPKLNRWKQLKPQHITTGIDGRQWIFTKRENSGIVVKVPQLDEAKTFLGEYSEW